MKNLWTIPYPRKPLGNYFGIVIAIGLGVNFILMVLQPFGTASWEHPDKMMILAGYGVIIAITGLLYYSISYYVFKRNGADGWNIIAEVIDVFACLLVCMTATYFYYNLIFGGTINFKSFVQYIGMASTVALLPILMSLYYLYTSWKDVTASQIMDTEDDDMITLITGQNQTDKIETKLSDLICIKAQDNYVMMYIRKGDQTAKHLIRSTLKKVADQIGEASFIKVHRSYLVNRKLVLGMSGNKSKASLILSHFEQEVPVSRTAYDMVKSIISS